MKRKGMNSNELNPQQVIGIIKKVFSASVMWTVKRKLDEVFDDQFNHYRCAWMRVYKFPGQIVQKTDFGYKDPYGLTKYYSYTVLPWYTFYAAEPLVPGDPVYIHQDGKAYKYTGEHS